MRPDHVFRPMTGADLPLIRRWLGHPHVREWWGDPVEQFALVSGDLNEPAMDQFIVLSGGQPFAYLQCYELTAWNTGFGPQPEGTRGIDLFIGVPGMIAPQVMNLMRIARAKGMGGDDSSSVIRVYEQALGREVRP